jgi:hypothetical protein
MQMIKMLQYLTGQTIVIQLIKILKKCSRREIHDTLPLIILREGLHFPKHLHEGRAQISLSFIAGISNLLGGLEVAYEHYRGSYGQRIMYSPVILSSLACGINFLAVINQRVARTFMPAISSLLLMDGIIGFFFHLRGVARKPGGWRIPIFNIIMGPPLFAPLLLGIGGFLGVMASFMRREDGQSGTLLPGVRWSREIRSGRFQKHMAVISAIAAFLSGAEALYSHYKSNFRYKWQQWSPILIAPLLTVVALGAAISPKLARRVLPAISLLAIVNGSIGFYYHSRGVKKRPGGIRHLVYNIMYGPPVFAPLLFAAAGFLGLIASIMLREKR